MCYVKKRIPVAVVFAFVFVLVSACSLRFAGIVAQGTPQQVQAAIDKGANVNANLPFGSTPLMFAADRNQNPEVITVLVKAGADVNAENGYGFTALMIAVTKNPNPEVITTLLKAGAEVNHQSNDGLTALILASAGNKNPEVTEALLKARRSTTRATALLRCWKLLGAITPR